MSYADHVLDDNPVGYWRLNSPPGTTTGIDSSGNGHTLTIDGTYSFGGSPLVKDDPATSYQQTSDALLYSLDKTWYPTGDMTIEAWVVATTTSSVFTIASQYQVFGSDSLFTLRFDSGTPIFYFWKVDGSLDSIQASGGIVAGSIHHVVATYDGTRARLYMDGALAATSPPYTPAGVNPYFRIGASGLGEYWRGNLQDVAWYDYALTDAQVLAHYRNGSGWADAVAALSPEVWYRVGANSAGTVAPDSSGHGRTGTYQGGVVYANQQGLVTNDNDQALYVSGGGQIRLSHDTWMDGPQTAVGIFKPASVSGISTLACVDDSGGGDVIMWRLRLADGQLVGFFNGDATGVVSPPGIIAADQTYLIAYSLDTTHEQIWVNGVKVAEAAGPAVIPVKLGPLRFGSLIIGAGESFNGVMDEMFVVSRVLTPTEHENLYTAMIGGSTTPPGDHDVTVRGSSTSTGHVDVTVTEGGAHVDVTVHGSGTSTGHVTATVQEVAPPSAGDHAVTVTGTGTSTGSVSTTIGYGAVTDNREGGRERLGRGIAHWTSPVIPPPAGTAVTEAVEVAHAFTGLHFVGPRRVPTYGVSAAKRRRNLDRIVVGGVDVTWFRGVPTPLPGYALIEPLGYGAASLVLPQVAAAFETPGVGELSWLRPGAPVLIQRVDRTTGEVVATDYKGIVISFGNSQGALICNIGGEASGAAALLNRQTPIFAYSMDLGRWGYYGINELRLPFEPRFGPVTGMTMWATGGTSQLDYLNALCAAAQDTDGNQWTIMPSETDGRYRMNRKDTTTIHGTVYIDDQRTTFDGTRDLSEEPNRIFAQGITPQGQRVRFGQYPGLIQAPAPPFPIAGGGSFGLGTSNPDTIDGAGITAMNNRLYVTKYISPEQEVSANGVVTPAIVRAIRALQADAGLAVTGRVGARTWAALYDLTATGYSLRLSKIAPAAQRSEVQEWFTTASGALKRRNPAYDPTVPRVDFNIDVGTGFTKWRIGQFALGELGDPNNWTGTITFGLGGLIRGAHIPETTITAGDVMSARELRAGMNLRLPLFAGGITVHVSAVNVNTDGTVSADVDTKARDAMKLWEVIARNRESRQNPARQWVRDHRASGITKDASEPFDEVGGILGDKVHLRGNRWTVIPIVAGQEGTIRSLRTNLNPNAEYVLAVFGRHISPTKLQRVIGNPLSKAGAKRWGDADVLADLDDTNFVLYVAGSDSQPCGYYPRVKTAQIVTTVTDSSDGSTHTETTTSTDDTTPGTKVTVDGTKTTTVVTTIISDLTGRWSDDAGFSYHTFGAPVLWVAVYPDRPTSLGPARVMWNQLEAGT